MRNALAAVATHFVADVHLTNDAPDTWRDFFAYLAGPARKAQTIYLLGDIFHAWIGDDDKRELALQARAKLAEVAAAGIELKFVFGNHDFMIGEKMASETGMQLLDEQLIATHEGRRILLLHGDTLITSDVEYQKSRRKVLSKAYLFMARRLPMKMRLRQAQRMLDGVDYTRFYAGGSLVDEELVDKLLDEHNADLMVHGHTHVPGVHEQRQGKQRWVLPHWTGGGGTGGWLELDASGLKKAGAWAES